MGVIEGSRRYVKRFDNPHTLYDQEPPIAKVGEFTAEFEKIRATLTVSTEFRYQMIHRSGYDILLVNLNVERPGRRTSSLEFFSVAFQPFDPTEVRKWLLRLEPAILTVLFHGQDNTVEERGLIRILLSLHDQTKELDPVLERESTERLKQFQS